MTPFLCHNRHLCVILYLSDSVVVLRNSADLGLNNGFISFRWRRGWEEKHVLTGRLFQLSRDTGDTKFLHPPRPTRQHLAQSQSLCLRQASGTTWGDTALQVTCVLVCFHFRTQWTSWGISMMAELTGEGREKGVTGPFLLLHEEGIPAVWRSSSLWHQTVLSPRAGLLSEGQLNHPEWHVFRI